MDSFVIKQWRMKRGRGISSAKLLPPHWRYVLVTVLERGDNYVIAKFMKLTGEEENPAYEDR